MNRAVQQAIATIMKELNTPEAMGLRGAEPEEEPQQEKETPSEEMSPEDLEALAAHLGKE